MKSLKDFAQLIPCLLDLQKIPEPFTPGEELFWNDPHISSQMLAAHLNPEIDAASRRTDTINQTVNWLIKTLALEAGASVLDLGCGPGLYTSRLAQAGMKVTGVDYSHRSIEFASNYAAQNGLSISYRFQNYLNLDLDEQFDAVLLIYGDFCPLNPDQRATLLRNISRVLKPSGKFVLDVSTRVCRKKHGNKNGWTVCESGFWKPTPHLLLEEGFDYPEQNIWLDQSIIVEADGKVSIYRNWFQDYSPATIREELEQNGFLLEGLWGDLTGQPYTPESEWIGLVTRKR